MYGVSMPAVYIDVYRYRRSHGRLQLSRGNVPLRLRGPLAVARVQLALNVSDLDEAVAFYSRLFLSEPAKRRPGYANFAVAEPPLKLVLFENPSQAGTLNHLGVEVNSPDEVVRASERLADAGLPTEIEAGTVCCHALQDKVWVSGADTRWEVYTVLADAPATASASVADVCCRPTSDPAVVGAG